MTSGTPRVKLKWRSRRYSPFYGAGLAGLAAVPLFAYFAPNLLIEGAAVTFFLIYLGIMGRRIPHLTVERYKNSRERDDAPAYAIILVTILAVVAAIGALFNALNRGSHVSSFEIALAFLSVIGGWLTLHTMFASHYAHHFWRHVTGPDGVRKVQGGLSFPETEEPAGLDFLYFSFVIGMTAQTSDVAITTTAMRRINLSHSLTAFFFNTVLVAATVNAAVALAG
ncbi:hypothetical protein ASD54_06760 [Rhizobium sp. Root149]|uniref:Putative membrane protein n=1 Tax=Rhizobium rhizoryzae TaxID=451876 RepID=A0A7W6PNN9_9HYPH|nr:MULTISPECIES: DUF1345 domain-containing protein [Rhizobium]KQZ54987.1 hypothetical protein ASD54_06760 [Rhizobium sp. Root149]MBB4142120.1 putative membrane protein [Rhizobium rhizoryzae]